MCESNRRERTILEILPDIIFIYDSSGNFIDCLTNNKDNLLLEKKTFIGKNLTDVVPAKKWSLYR